MASGEMTEAEFTSFLAEVFAAAAHVSRDGALHYICMDWRHLHEALSAGKAIYSSFLNLCVWNKDNGGMGSLYRSKHELVLLFKVGTKPHTNNIELGRHGRNRTNVWEYAGVNTFRAGRLDELAMHPTVKPVALIADALKDTSKRMDVILDPFCGSGSMIMRRRRPVGEDMASKSIRDTLMWRCVVGNAIVEDQPSLGSRVQPLKRSPNSEQSSEPVEAFRIVDQTEMALKKRNDFETRFKKGQSGNPGGRPKGRKNNAGLLTDAFFKKIKIRDTQGVRSVPKIVAAAEVCLNNALKGDLRSFAKAMEIAEKLRALQAGPIHQEITRITRTIIDPKNPQTN